MSKLGYLGTYIPLNVSNMRLDLNISKRTDGDPKYSTVPQTRYCTVSYGNERGLEFYLHRALAAQQERRLDLDRNVTYRRLMEVYYRVKFRAVIDHGRRDAGGSVLVSTHSPEVRRQLEGELGMRWRTVGRCLRFMCHLGLAYRDRGDYHFHPWLFSSGTSGNIDRRARTLVARKEKFERGWARYHVGTKGDPVPEEVLRYAEEHGHPVLGTEPRERLGEIQGRYGKGRGRKGRRVVIGRSSYMAKRASAADH